MSAIPFRTGHCGCAALESVNASIWPPTRQRAGRKTCVGRYRERPSLKTTRTRVCTGACRKLGRRGDAAVASHSVENSIRVNSRIGRHCSPPV